MGDCHPFHRACYPVGKVNALAVNAGEWRKLSLIMTIASLYPSLPGQEMAYSDFDWDFIRALLHYSEEINDFHVFLPLDCHPPSQFQDISNVYVYSVMELSEFFQEKSVDVWHDFGYTDVSHLTHIRGLSRQNFPITMVAQPWRLTSDPGQNYKGLSEYDALICSKSSIGRIVRSAHQQPGQCSLSPDSVPEVFTIPPGVNTTKGNIADKRDARHLLDLPEQVIIILCLTDFSVYEGADLFPLIHAFQTVAEKYEEVRLIIGGSDKYGYADKIQKFLNDSHLHRHIVLRPNASESAQSLLLSAADIFISPSDTLHTDNHIQILTAMSYSLPVIATNDDENGMIDHSKNGLKLRRICKSSSYDSLNNYLPLVSEAVKSLIISQGIVVDTEQIVEFLTLLIEDKGLRQTLGDAACDYVTANHEWSTIVERYIHLWYTLREKVSSKPPHTILSENQAGDNASSLPAANTRALPFFAFMSEGVEDNTPLQLTSSGEMRLETQHLISYDAMKDIIYPPIVFEILNLTRSVTTVSQIINALLLLADRDDTDDLVPNITYHIMWCLKQGFISLSGTGE